MISSKIEYLKSFLVILLLYGIPYFTSAQYVNNVNLNHSDNDTSIVIQHTQNGHTSPYTISAKSILIPAVLIVYGFSTLVSSDLQSVDKSIKQEIWTNHPHGLFKLDNYIQYAPAASVYALNIFGIKGKSNLLDRTLIYILSESILEVSVQSLKSITKIERPDGSATNSFPLGHTSTAFAAAEFLRQEYKSISPWYGIAGYSVATFTAYLRIYNNRHWFSDVVEGAGIGILSTRLAYCLYPKIKQLFSNEPRSNTMIIPGYHNGTISLYLLTNF